MAWFLLLIFATGRKEDTEMKERYSKKLTYMGAGCGVVLFAIFGLLPGSFLGGVMGLNIAGSLLGTPVTAGIASRLIVAASMVVGVMVSGIMFVTASSLVGWLIGTVVDGLRAEKKEMITAEHK
jgi:predicted benzoate:H+ symporter BenE